GAADGARHQPPHAVGRRGLHRGLPRAEARQSRRRADRGLDHLHERRPAGRRNLGALAEHSHPRYARPGHGAASAAGRPLRRASARRDLCRQGLATRRRGRGADEGAAKAMIAFVLFLAIQWTDVATALGRAGTMQPGDVYKVAFPRSDLDVVADGVKIKPALALGSWAAFVPDGDHAMVMGDLVLLESEVNPVISILQAGGVEQSAVHNHLIGESPHVMYVHFEGHGDA